MRTITRFIAAILAAIGLSAPLVAAPAASWTNFSSTVDTATVTNGKWNEQGGYLTLGTSEADGTIALTVPSSITGQTTVAVTVMLDVEAVPETATLLSMTLANSQAVGLQTASENTLKQVVVDGDTYGSITNYTSSLRSPRQIITFVYSGGARSGNGTGTITYINGIQKIANSSLKYGGSAVNSIMIGAVREMKVYGIYLFASTLSAAEVLSKTAEVSGAATWSGLIWVPSAPTSSDSAVLQVAGEENTLTLDNGKAISLSRLFTQGEGSLAFAGTGSLSSTTTTIATDTDVSDITASLGAVTVAADKTLTTGPNTTMTGVTFGSATAKVKVTGSTPLSAIPYGMLSKTGTVEIEPTINLPENENLSFNTAQTLTYSANVNALRLVVGDSSSANATITQVGGTINLSSTKTACDSTTASAILLGHWPTTTTYNLQGGKISAPNGALCLGWDGKNSTITVGKKDGTKPATLKIYGLKYGSDSKGARNNPAKLLIQENGLVEIGEGGIDLSGASNHQVELAGGTLLATATASANIAHANGLNVTASSTIAADPSATLTINKVSGSDNLTIGTVGQTGKVVISDLSAYTGTVTLTSGTLVLPVQSAAQTITPNAEGCTGTLVLRLSDAQLASPTLTTNVSWSGELSQVKVWDSRGVEQIQFSAALAEGTSDLVLTNASPIWSPTDENHSWSDTSLWSGQTVPTEGLVTIDCSALTAAIDFEIPAGAQLTKVVVTGFESADDARVLTLSLAEGAMIDTLELLDHSREITTCSVGSDASLTLDCGAATAEAPASLPTFTGTGTVSLTNGYATATTESFDGFTGTLNLEKSATLRVSDGAAVKRCRAITGSGTLRFQDVVPSVANDDSVDGVPGITDSTAWIGTITVAGITGTGTQLRPNAYGNANSTVEFDGVAGWMSTLTVPRLRLTGEGLTLSNGNTYNNANICVNELVGDGKFQGATTNKNWMYSLLIGSAADFEGSFALTPPNAKNENLVIQIGSTTPPSSTTDFRKNISIVNGAVSVKKPWIPASGGKIRVLSGATLEVDTRTPESIDGNTARSFGDNVEIENAGTLKLTSGYTYIKVSGAGEAVVPAGSKFVFGIGGGNNTDTFANRLTVEATGELQLRTSNDATLAVPTLTLNGKISGGANLTIAAGKTLSGTGTISVPVTFENGSVIKAVDSDSGAVTCNGTVTLPEAGTVTVQATEYGAAVLKKSDLDVTKFALPPADGESNWMTAGLFTEKDGTLLLVAKPAFTPPEGGSEMSDETTRTIAKLAAASGYYDITTVVVKEDRNPAAVEVFNNVMTVNDDTPTKATISYDFGVSDITVKSAQLPGDNAAQLYVVVCAKVERNGGEGAAADYANGTTVSLWLNGRVCDGAEGNGPEATELTDEQLQDLDLTAGTGEKWFAVPMPKGVDTHNFTVRATK